MKTGIWKYPRTAHIEGSRVQPGDDDLDSVPFAAIDGLHVVVEEKVDGANAAISFDDDGTLLLQSRGHYLIGGGRERQFALFKQWANCHREALWHRLGARHVLYGEWLFAKHTIFYDALPHYFLEFDLLDLETGEFFDTPRRHEFLDGLPVASVRVLHAGPVESVDALREFVGPSAFITAGHLDHFCAAVAERRFSVERALKETDPSAEMEGLYLKVEENGCVTARYKWVRHSFHTAVINSESHWQSRPIIPNRLRPGVDLFSA